MTACSPFGGLDQLQVDRAESRGAVLGRDGVVHRAAGNIFELLITDRFWFVGLFAHMVGCLVGFWLWFSNAALESLEAGIWPQERVVLSAQETACYRFKLGVRKVCILIGEILWQNDVHQIFCLLQEYYLQPIR